MSYRRMGTFSGGTEQQIWTAEPQRKYLIFIFLNFYYGGKIRKNKKTSYYSRMGTQTVCHL